MKEIIDEIKKYLDVEDLTSVSRLIKRNIVFKTIINNKPYAIKVYFQDNNIERHNKEENIYKYFMKHNIINVPRVITSINSNMGPIIVIEWIEGTSIKKEMKQGLPINDLYSMYNDMNKIWNLDINDFPNIEVDKFGIDNRLSNNLDTIIELIRSYKPNIDFNELISLYNDLYNNINPHFDRVINSDISAHEYIIKDNKGYWIDFERFCIGDPNNDLARSFMSLTNGIINRKEDINKVYDICKEQQYFNKNVFIYYLIEKVICSIYDAPNDIGDDVINFYINFIKEKLIAKEKQLLK